jgi:hypothetical protein
MAEDVTVLELRMEENSFIPRDGVLRVVQPMNEVSPFATDPLLASLSTISNNLKVLATWESICGNNTSLAGGDLDGWLLGPVVEGTIDGFPIEETHNELRAALGLGPGNFATMAYAVLVGDIFGAPIDGEASRISCSGGVSSVEYGVLYVFLWPDATTFGDKGFYVGDVFYLTEIGLQHYFLYNSSPLL